MNVLTIGTDRKIFEDGSAVRERVVEYGKLFGELHIVVFSKRKSQITKHKFQTNHKTQIPNTNVFIYSTNSISKFFYITDAIKIGKKIIKNSLNDFVITTQDPFETGIAGWFITRKFKSKLQLQVHTDFLNKHFIGHSALNKIRVIIAKFLLPKADCIRVVGTKIKDSIISRFQIPDSRFFLLPIFVDIEKIKNALIITNLHKKYPQFDKIILMASRLEREKNISLAISAIKEVVEKYPKTGLVIVGDGNQRKALKLQITNYKLQNNVILEDWQDKKIIYSYYKSANLFLITSDYEGYGMTIIEALAAGLSVLSTDVGIAGEVGAIITGRDNIAQNIIKYIEKSPKTAKLVNYPYKNKAEYLDKFKQSFKCGY